MYINFLTPFPHYRLKPFFTALLQFPNYLKASEPLTSEDGVKVLMIFLVLKDET